MMKHLDCFRACGSRRGSAAAPGLLAIWLALAPGMNAGALPTQGVVTQGSASIAVAEGGGQMRINQDSARGVIDWNRFGIAGGETVTFNQPDASAIMLNRVVGGEASSIAGALSANGKVFLVNPNGILFTNSASINVGGLVASTLSIGNDDFLAGRYRFGNAGPGTVVNQGNIALDPALNGAGYVALLSAAVVRNEGAITAPQGAVALAAGQSMTLDLAGDRLLNIQVSRDTANALVENRGLVEANGGLVLMTSQAAGSLLATAVNNSGTIRARTVSQQGNGTIRLEAGAAAGQVTVDGTLDAGADAGLGGGRIETSAARVGIGDAADITTFAASGLPSGEWTIRSASFTTGGGATRADGADVSGDKFQQSLGQNNIVIATEAGANAGAAPGGDITLNAPLANWRRSGDAAATKLELRAGRDVNIDAPISGGGGALTVCCGRDINIRQPVFLSHPLSLSAGRDLNVFADLGTGGENSVLMCAARDVNVNGAEIFMNTGNEYTGGLFSGLTIIAGYGAGRPGDGGGTVRFTGGGRVTLSGGTFDPVIVYNPSSYATPADFSPFFTFLGNRSRLSQAMLVYPIGDKVFDGSATTLLSGLKGNPDGVALLAQAGSQAVFSDAGIGSDKPITFSGYGLTGQNAAFYALPIGCCDQLGRSTGTIQPRPPAPPAVPPVVPPVVPPETPPVVPPVVPPETPPVVPPVVPPETPPVVPPVVPPETPPVVPPAPPPVVPPVVPPETPHVVPPLVPSATQPVVPPFVPPVILQPPASSDPILRIVSTASPPPVVMASKPEQAAMPPEPVPPPLPIAPAAPARRPAKQDRH
jgi:filamentous hemagglutinin family protein